ncbi:hydrolase family protein (plasmid) [Arthrobacter sp. Rue61a]|nr:hydrolase family protein [Arthrobacter sp. Rue61a]
MTLIGTALLGNSYRFTTEAVMIPGPNGNLTGVLTTPLESEIRGLVVMVHGDGPVNATHDGLYSPWFKGAAAAGFATLSWSKPGLDNSDGNWLGQSMEDRTAEVDAAINWARQSGRTSTERIVLWGASQAGWVLPKVVSSREDVHAIIAVGPAINWLRQGRYNLLSELRHEARNSQEREQAITQSDRTRQLLEHAASYQEYCSSRVDAEPMSEQRWNFVLKNFRSDATEDLLRSSARSIPVHLVIGSHDRNVDVDETEKTYKSIFGPLLSVKRVEGNHSLARPVVEENAAVGLVTGLVWPRALLAPGAIDSYTEFLAKVAAD